jgi:hypothetical protein
MVHPHIPKTTNENKRGITESHPALPKRDFKYTSQSLEK